MSVHCRMMSASSDYGTGQSASAAFKNKFKKHHYRSETLADPSTSRTFSDLFFAKILCSIQSADTVRLEMKWRGLISSEVLPPTGLISMVLTFSVYIAVIWSWNLPQLSGTVPLQPAQVVSLSFNMTACLWKHTLPEATTTPPDTQLQVCTSDRGGKTFPRQI